MPVKTELRRTVYAVQHVQCETPGLIAEVLKARGIQIEHFRPFEGQMVPAAMGDAAGLIVMGGPMGVYEQDRYPFLRQEIHLIQQALREEKPILGVCLGSQLLAATLGAAVTEGIQKEIGWHPVFLTPQAMEDPAWRGLPPSYTALHWHGDVFELPRGAVRLASSALTEHQAFRYGRNAYGILFHMEVTKKIVKDMVRSFPDELHQASVDGGEIVNKASAHLPALNRIGETVVKRWAALIGEKA